MEEDAVLATEIVEPSQKVLQKQKKTKRKAFAAIDE